MATSHSRRRVVVTGTGVVTAVGQNVSELWSALHASRCGIRPIEKFYQNHPHFIARSSIKDCDLAAGLAAQVDPFDQRARLQHIKRDKLIQLGDRFSLFAAAAAGEAMTQAALAHPLPDVSRTACIIGSAEAGVVNIEAAYRHIFELKNAASHPLTLLRIIGSSAAAHLSIEYGIKGPVFGVCGACASGADAIEIGRNYIRQGLVDVSLVGASDAPLTYGTMRLWEASGLLSNEGLFPFAKSRSGTVLGEGAGILVLEELEHARARGATILAELCGIGTTADATDMVTPDKYGAAAAMRTALEDADIDCGQIDYINAHGSGTQDGDEAESEAIRMVFGDGAKRVPVSGTKSIYGNPLGASAGIEAAICIKAIAEGWIPPNAGVDVIDPNIGLDVVTVAGRSQRVRYAMSNTFGLTGLNASLILGPPPM
jgi:nodulation protein E